MQQECSLGRVWFLPWMILLLLLPARVTGPPAAGLAAEEGQQQKHQSFALTGMQCSLALEILSKYPYRVSFLALPPIPGGSGCIQSRIKLGSVSAASLLRGAAL
jgi:hypothetical protein